MKGGKIISTNYNCHLGRPTNYICRKVNIVKEYGTRHSEIRAFSLLKKTLMKERKINSIKIINFRLNNSGEVKNSKPCKACAKVLERLGVSEIIYSDDHGRFIKDKLKNLQTQYSSMSIGIIDY
jgi:hypothetical protein